MILFWVAVTKICKKLRNVHEISCLSYFMHVPEVYSFIPLRAAMAAPIFLKSASLIWARA